MILNDKHGSYEGLCNDCISAADSQNATPSTIAACATVTTFPAIATIAMLRAATSASSFAAVTAITTIATGQVNDQFTVDMNLINI